MPASFTTFAQRVISARMNAANSSRHCGAGTTTISAKRCLTSGICNTFTRSVCSLSSIGTGVPAGAHYARFIPCDKPPGWCENARVICRLTIHRGGHYGFERVSETEGPETG
jgi:hypothetical protein